ncbi:hypothetical protein, partial [Bifidobacterium sp.]|uniref:hypothetical protein n=1 Tax=Bifidobacterium sp. TaxID=41200 RepID=UPI0025BFDC0C
PTGTITAGNVQIERSRCTETSADAEHLYLITYTNHQQRNTHLLLKIRNNTANNYMYLMTLRLIL